ncbi:hypothetical protein SAMN02745158_00980 [Lactonifactor longoviformis DSM 17459]|uniref:Uncharacterized protein n=1 Tax=Lactonifactor longoviformis DSM 17459 TaxID=1122155 RepID=A0A1M4UTS6_9CLOT|nr:hypothetical protein SAMN02745158_00980 [Lactonifactor longoviformis DSM 17459]
MRLPDRKRKISLSVWLCLYLAFPDRRGQEENSDEEMDGMVSEPFAAF